MLQLELFNLKMYQIVVDIFVDCETQLKVGNLGLLLTSMANAHIHVKINDFGIPLMGSFHIKIANSFLNPVQISMRLYFRNFMCQIKLFQTNVIRPGLYNRSRG